MTNSTTYIELNKGNPDAYRELFKYIYPRLKGYCRLFVANEKQAEDIIQDCFITLWEKRSTIKTEKSVESFLFVMARHRCLNFLKSKKLEEGLLRLDDLKAVELQHLYQLDFTEEEHQSIEDQIIISFQQAIEELPEKRKNVFKSCKIEGRNQSDVALELGISIKAVEKHISAAKQQLRSKLSIQFPSMLIFIAMLFQ